MSSPAPNRSLHGGLSDRERRVLRARLGPWVEVEDLSVNINPFGPPKRVETAIRRCALSSYPDTTAEEARSAYGDRLGVLPESIVFGNGATELLWTLARHLVDPTRPALIVEPTFSEYARATEAFGGRVVEHRSASPEFAHDVDAIVRDATRIGAASVYVCRPNNPTGTVLPFEDLLRLAHGVGGLTVVLDESFLSLSDAAHDEFRELPDNVVRLRSLTKDFGIPGIRVGYLIASAALADSLERFRPPWTTSSPAQAAALAALEEDKFLGESRKLLLEGRDELVAILSDFGRPTTATATFFALAEVGSGAAFREALLGHGIVVRDGASFGLPGHVRIAAGTPRGRTRLRRALESTTRTDRSRR